MAKIKETSTNFANKQALANDCLEVYASNITERMLTLQLRKLEENNVVKRTVYAEVPPRVEYELTPIGYELKAIINELKKWGKNHKAMRASDALPLPRLKKITEHNATDGNN